MPVNDPANDQAERSRFALATDAYAAARDKAADYYGSARDAASSARRAASDGVSANPLAAVMGGIAVGVLIGALLPRTRREDELIGPYARDITGRARDAAEAARLAGFEKLDELGFNKDRANATVQQLTGAARTAAEEAGHAAVKTVKEGGGGSNAVQAGGASGPATH